MTPSFKPGDQVSWNTAQGKTTGKVVKKLTDRTSIKDHTVAASQDDPQYLVKSAIKPAVRQPTSPMH
jgi:hypothetical protein